MSSLRDSQSLKEVFLATNRSLLRSFQGTFRSTGYSMKKNIMILD